MPRLTATSTASGNFAVANSFPSLSASSSGYCLPGVSLVFHACMRLGMAGMSGALHVYAHAARAAGDGPHRRFQIRGGQIGRLGLSHFLDLLAGNLPHLGGIRSAAALFN